MLMSLYPASPLHKSLEVHCYLAAPKFLHNFLTMKQLTLIAAIVAALLTVLSTRLIVPALITLYYVILKSFEPDEPQPQLALAAAGAVQTIDAPKPAAKKATRTKSTSTRTTRKRVTKAQSTEVK